MKTVVEIKDRIKKGFKNDFFGFGISDLVEALPFEDAKEYLNEDFLSKQTAEAEWEVRRLKSNEDVKKAMVDYLPFAWEKANNERGLSADRSIQHFIAWAWLYDEEFQRNIETMYDTNYAPYGKPILKYISEKLGYDYTWLN